MNNFDVIRQDGRLLYEYIRGSHLYGLNNEDSDIDTSGVYVCTRDELFGCFGYKPQVTDSRHDNTWYEIGELVRLLLKSNPTVLESLFVPEDKVIGDIHPIMQMVIDQRDQFISKQCLNPFFGYAKSQIEKARGLNKKIVNNTNPEKTDRERYIPDAKAHGYEVIGIFFQSRVRECIARNEKREEKVPVKAIPCIQNKLQLPEYAEGFDQLFFVRINDYEFEIIDWRE